MPLDPKKLLGDMQDAANAVAEFTAGKVLADFAGDRLLRAAVYYEFVVIGEALSQLRQLDPDAVSKISESGRIIGFRNQIIHGYARIDDEITWRIVTDKLPTLRQELQTLLAC